MSSVFALQKAAQAWATPKTEKITMDPILAEAFAEIIDEIHYLKAKPYLGNATTEELLNEIKARLEVSGLLQYKTIDSD